MEMYLPALRDNIIISCGHTVVKGTQDTLSFGIRETISQSELQSVINGINLAQPLRQQGKRVTFSVSLSDATLFEGKNLGRRVLKDAASSGHIFSVIPQEYVSLFKAAGFSHHDVSLTLQTDATRLFEKQIKTLMKTVNNQRQLLNQTDFLTWSFTHYQSIFLTDPQRNLFSMTHPALFDTQQENQFFESEAWRTMTLQPRWLKHVPLLRLKKNPVINLYQRGGRVLCPGAYAGFLKTLNPDCDVIELLSRQDDAFISEKVARGIIASKALYANPQQCLLVISNEDNEQEVSFFPHTLTPHTDLNSAEALYHAFDCHQIGDMILL